MNALHQPQPPPSHWHLRVKLRESGDPRSLLHVRNIINSYLRPQEQWRRTRVAKGEHLYELASIDPFGQDVFKRSIFETVLNENSHEAIITKVD